ncbi:phage tail sheath family protein [Corallococcus exiguus]|uniref:phage tail sheath family protein n=1 Tax=Corallococcus exiguus TaxID=83462 RepID=UPI001494665D|nr:phage tail sheath C-terminal domain-containing protein [Corallococcus exiguus]NPD27117.1 phage tail sheath family protein [Corallococcus exiguus]
MPATLNYPGVYVEEVPSGVRTITGVPTSVTAFVGRARRGPVNDPVICNGYGDFERTFGGLWELSTLGFSVRDFFLNGGGQAVVVRLHHEADAATLTLPTGGGDLTLATASPGAWGGQLRVTVNHSTRPPLSTNEFNLIVTDTGTNTTERFLNLSTVPGSSRYYPAVLEQGSTLLRVTKDNNGDYVVPGTSRPNVATDLAPAAGNVGDDGGALVQADIVDGTLRSDKKGLYALEKTDIFNLLVIPPYKNPDNGAGGDVDDPLVTAAVAYCEERRAVFIADPPSAWNTVATAEAGFKASSLRSSYAAQYFPRLCQPNPLRENQLETFAPSGAVAGVISRTDTHRGVWKAPAGLDALLTGIPKLSVPLTDKENGQLNPLGLNCLRSLPAAGRVVWGARTTRGGDQLADQWKYLPVRRLALYIEESLYRGIQWVVFEPNDEPLWSQIRLNVGAFMQNLFRQGAFQGQSPRDAYFVKCDRETTTQNDINLGVVNIVVGFAPLKPTEFVVLKLQQMAGQVAA